MSSRTGVRVTTMKHTRGGLKVSQQQIVRLRAYVENGAVMLASDDSNLRRGSDGNWKFTIVKDSPAEVVFELSASGNAAARSALRSSGDSWDKWVKWGGTNPCRSPVFVHPQEFRLEMALGQASSANSNPPIGGGFFEIRDEGG